jgi:hypothetical protein
MPVADDDYRKKKAKANLQGRGNQYDPMDIIGFGGGTAKVGSAVAAPVVRAATPIIKSAVSAAANFVKGFGASTVRSANASRGVMVTTARGGGGGGVVARIPKQLGPGPTQALATIPRVATRTAVGRPAPSMRNAARIGVAAGVAAGAAAAGINDAYRGGSKPASTTPSAPTTSSTGPKTKDLAYFMAEAKKKGKTGKGVSNYAYTMLKDSKMRSGTSALTGQRISGTKTQ